MYKSIEKIILVAILFFPLSCAKDYLEVENKNQLTDGNFYQTQEDFRMALNSLYTPLAHGGMFGRHYYLMFGSFEDRILWESPGLDRLAVSPSETRVNWAWRDLYMGVYRTNTFIRQLKSKPEVEGFSDEMRRNYIGQARALRAAYNFFLVVFYNEPIFYDDQTIPHDLDIPLGNGKPEQFWDLIKEDLSYAAENLPAWYPAEDLGRITSGGAAAMLGKAMLFKHYYFHVRTGSKDSEQSIVELRLARESFEYIINSGVHYLIQPQEPKTRNDYLYAYLCNFSHVDLVAGSNVYPSENNAESLWEIQYSDTRVGGFYMPGYLTSGTPLGQHLSPHGHSWRNQEIHPDLWDAFETEGAPAGFDRDPRSYASVYIDGDTMDFRPDASYYSRTFRSGLNSQRIARGRGLIPREDNPYPTQSFGLKKYFFPVYDGKDAPMNDPTNRRIIRFSDVLLMHAEVCYLLGEPGAGLTSLNAVRERAGMPGRTALTKEVIIHERDVELSQEGHRWFDLIRWSFDPEWGIDMQRKLSRQTGPDGDGSFFIKGKHEFLPIPLREINLNDGKLVQNPGW